jgi:uncharacterized hydantoinase/oxoprolinase family protein
MQPTEKGPLQKVGIHMTQEEGDAFKKSNDAAKAILDAIGSNTSSSSEASAVPEFDPYSAI